MSMRKTQSVTGTSRKDKFDTYCANKVLTVTAVFAPRLALKSEIITKPTAHKIRHKYRI